MRLKLLTLVLLSILIMSTPINQAFATNDKYYYKQQYYISQCEIDKMWKAYGYKGKGVKVAVIDTGLDNNSKDFDYTKIMRKKNFTRESSGTDNYQHGNGVISVIGSKRGNKIGITGIMPNATIYSIKVFDKQGNCTGITEAIETAINLDVDVINLSLGGKNYSQAQQDVVTKAVNKGIIVVASAGNDGKKTVQYPADYDGVIKVSGCTNHGKFASWSSYGNSDCMAPGEKIAIQYTCNKYGMGNGTSFSAPIVSAMAVMCKQIDPSINSKKFMTVLKKSSSNNGTKKTKSGYGCVNFYKAAKYLRSHR